MTVDLGDVQGLLRGYGARFKLARHFILGIGDGARARTFVGALTDGTLGDGMQVTAAEERKSHEWPDSCLNIGVTWPGLKALGVPDSVLKQFPPAFRDGPAARAQLDPRKPNSVGLGDVGESAPERWSVGAPNGPEVHIVVSLYAQDERHLKDVSDVLRAAFAVHRLTEHCHRDAQALRAGADGPSRVHFGYRDGIAQPSIIGIPGRTSGGDMQPPVPTGDVLLGRDYVNSFGGNYAESLPNALIDNATYGAFRILYQDVAAFERLLDDWAQAASAERELIAAKLMGRWRNGTPLVLAPTMSGPNLPAVPAEALNAFDYAPADGHPAFYDDARGLRCPIGAHARRLNPRGAQVMGKAHSRRLVRRNMPYGPELAPGASNDGVDRGLVGYFLCGDLETQWEFIQAAWVNQDLATHGVRGTREPIGGAQPDGGGTFTIPTTESPGPIVLRGLPNLVLTRGSAYCLLPGIGGLRHIASLSASNGRPT
jgi:deferrochelatase/peroxidase EfeB